MNLTLVNSLTNNLVQALCNTLIHSLWQGLILAAVAGVIVVLTRKSTPAKRYNLLIAALMLFAVATVYTFASVLYHAPASIDSAMVKKVNTPVVNADHQTVLAFNAPALQKVLFTDKVMSFLNSHASNLVFIWFLIVCARSLQLVTGLHSLYHLRRRSIFPVEEEWVNRVQELAVKLGIKQVVGIAQSGMAKVPMVIGHLKPLILMPIGLITALPPAEIEAILVHELAHIRRRDYLVNLLVSLMEIIFFFNPAVLWLSSLINTERENCCDDMAIAQTSSKVNYIRALVSCQEYQLSAPAYAMALNGTKGHLMGRVKRMVSGGNQSLNLMEKSLLAVCLLTAGLFTAAFSNAKEISKAITTVTKVVTTTTTKRTTTNKPLTNQERADIAKKTFIPYTDTISTGKCRVYQPGEVDNGTSISITNNQYNTCLLKQNGILYQLNYRANVLSSMQVNGKNVSADKMQTYKPIISKMLGKAPSNIAVAERVEVAQVAERADVAQVAQPAEPALVARAAKTAELARLDAELQKKQEELSNTRQLKDSRNYNQNQAIADSVKHAHALNTRTNIKVNVPVNVPIVAMHAQEPGQITDKTSEQFIKELINDGVLQKRDNSLSFKLSSKEFVLNGKKQPEELYQRYKAKYLKPTSSSTEWSWVYNYDVSKEVKTK